MLFHNLFNSLQDFKLASGKIGTYYALSALEAGETTPALRATPP